MKRTLLLLGFALFAKLGVAQNFTEGNIVLLRVGDEEYGGNYAGSNYNCPLFLDEYSIIGTTATLAQTVALPIADNGINKRIVAPGNSSNEGLMSRSADGKYLLIPGYVGNVSDKNIVATTKVYNSPSTVERVIAVVDYQKSINTSNTYTGIYENNNFRSVTSYDASSFWGVGGGSNTSVQYLSSATATIGGSNLLQARSFKNKLYVTGKTELYDINDKANTNQAATSSNANYTKVATGLTNVQSFCIADQAGETVMYILEVGTPFIVKKYALISGVWTAKGSVNGPTGSKGLAIESKVVNSNNVELYIVSNTSTSQTDVYQLLDVSGYSGNMTANTPTNILSVTSDYSYRGIALAPVKNSVLPVKLTDFKATHIGSAVQLSWTTASEKDNDYFEVLKSTGEGFKVIDRINGNGTTDQISNYNYTDKELSSGTVYYQLRQIDKNGQAELSSVLSVKPARLAAESQIQVQASLSAQQVTVNFNSSTAGQVQLTIRDISGKLITTKAIVVGVGENSFTIPVTLSQAVYIAVISKSGKTQAVKFIPNK